MIIELCCGYGRWTNDSIRLDIDVRTSPDVIADVRSLPLRAGIKPDLVVATPPCTYISGARLWRYGFNPQGIAQALEIAASCLRAFLYLEGKDFIFEWGTNVEFFLGHKIQFTYDKYDEKNAVTSFYSNNKSLLRAIIPDEVKQSILGELMT